MAFDPRKIEFSMLTPCGLVELYPVRDGEPSGSSEKPDRARWGYRILRTGSVIAVGEDMYTEVTITYPQAARLALRANVASAETDEVEVLV